MSRGMNNILIGENFDRVHADRIQKFKSSEFAEEVKFLVGMEPIDAGCGLDDADAIFADIVGASIAARFENKTVLTGALASSLPVKLRAVTTDAGRGVSTRFSPDGEHLAFATNGNCNIFSIISGEKGPSLAPTSRIGEDAGDIGFSMLDISWGGPATCFTSCWAPALCIQRRAEDKTWSIDMANLADCGSGTGQFCCFSVAALDDTGSKVVCGTNDHHVFAYDVSVGEEIYSSDAHRGDVNAVCSVDENIFASGGDDTAVFLHDLRAQHVVGSLPGHTLGLMSLDSRGDGRYLLSNSKDQSTKLWDLRTTCSFSSGAPGGPIPFARWDYRSGPYSGPPPRCALKQDVSVLSLFGHENFVTLCRARFSPLASTGSRYAITGSFNNAAHIYDLLNPESPPVLLDDHENVVRDVTWSPTDPFIATASWDGRLRLFSS